MSSPQGFDPKEIIYRIGTFFLLVGIGLVAFFVLSEAARQVSFNYLCWGLIVLILGILVDSLVFGRLDRRIRRRRGLVQ